MNSRGFFVAILAVFLTGCQLFDKNKPRNYAKKPSDQKDAASVSVAALPPIQFDLIRHLLKPNEPAKSASEFRATSIERTLSILESTRSSIGGGFSANLLGVTKAKSSSTVSKSSTTDGVSSETESTTNQSTRDVVSGERPELDVSAPGLGDNAWALASFASQLDVQLAMDASNYIYQNAKLTDIYYDLDLSQDNYQAWVVQLKVNVQPYVRDMPYDVRANLEFSAKGSGASKSVRLVPLFATGNYEASNYTNSLTKLAQVYANVTAITGGTGLGAAFERRLESLMQQSGVDINTRISVGVHKQNQARVSIPAAFSPRSGYETREQDYTIMLLAYVQETCRGSKMLDSELTISTKWGMIDADTGKYLNAGKTNTAGTALPLLPGTETVRVPLLPIESVLPKQQSVIYVDDGTSSTKIEIPGAAFLPSNEFDAYLVRDKNAAAALANGPSVCLGANKFIRPSFTVPVGTPVRDVDDVIAATNTALKDDVLSVSFPSLMATLKESPNWFLRLETTQVCGTTFKLNCYPIVKNVAKSGKPTPQKSPFKLGVLSKSVRATSGGDQKEQRATVTAYIQTTKGVAPPSQFYRVQVKNATIVPNGGVNTLLGQVDARTQQDIIDNAFVAKIDSSFELVVKDLQGDKIQLLVIPWDRAGKKPTAIEKKQEIEIKVEK